MIVDEYVNNFTNLINRKRELDIKIIELTLEKRDILKQIKELRNKTTSNYWKYINNHRDRYEKIKLSNQNDHSEYNDQQNLSDE